MGASRQLSALDIQGALGSPALTAAANLGDVQNPSQALNNLGGATKSAPSLSGSFSLTGKQGVAITGTGQTSNYPLECSTLILTGATATYAAHTLNLPSTPHDGQICRVTSTGPTITTLTVTPQAGATITGAPTTISPSAPFTLQWIASISIWVRV